MLDSYERIRNCNFNVEYCSMFSCLYRFNLKAVNIIDCFIIKYKHKNLTYSIVFFLEICTRVIYMHDFPKGNQIDCYENKIKKTGKFSIIIFFKLEH